MNGKGSVRRPENNKQYRDNHERIFKKPMQVEDLEEFYEKDLGEGQADVEDFLQDRVRNED